MPESSKIFDSIVESEKEFLKTLNYEIPYLPKKKFLEENKETGFYTENGHILHLRFHNSTGNYYQNLIPSLVTLQYSCRWVVHLPAPQWHPKMG